MTTIYVGNLPFSATEQDIKVLFERHGKVDSVKLINDRETGKPRGFGFVEMGSERGASRDPGPERLPDEWPSAARQRSAGTSAAPAPGWWWSVPPLTDAGLTTVDSTFDYEPRLGRGSFSSARRSRSPPMWSRAPVSRRLLLAACCAALRGRTAHAERATARGARRGHRRGHRTRARRRRIARPGTARATPTATRKRRCCSSDSSRT